MRQTNRAGVSRLISSLLNVVATANYYRNQLGFHYDRFWNEPPSFCMVKRNGIIIMLAQLEAPDQPSV